MTKKVYTAEELRTRTAKAPLTQDMHRVAAKEGLSLTGYLEKMDPSEPNDSMDAFERQMAVANIRLNSDPARGVYADKVERFYASSAPASNVLFPEFIQRTMRAAMVAQDFLALLIAVRTPIDSDTYRSIYLDMSSATTFRMKRTAEGAEIPAAKILTQEHTIDLHKYGIRLEATYEVVRRMRIDMLQIHLGQIALRTALDKQSQALAVIVNGDGNNNAATSVDSTTLDSASTTALTYKAWIAWLMSFYPYQCNVVVGNSDMILQVLTMTFPSMDPLQLLALMGNAGGGIPTRVEMQPGVFVPVTLLLNADVPATTLIGIDNRFALEEITEIGADLTETDKIINRQLNEIVISEVVGYAKLYNEATKLLTVS